MAHLGCSSGPCTQNLKMSYLETMIGFLIVEDMLSAIGITEDQRVPVT